MVAAGRRTAASDCDGWGMGYVAYMWLGVKVCAGVLLVVWLLYVLVVVALSALCEWVRTW